MSRNEVTSKSVASKAGKLLAGHKKFMKQLNSLHDLAVKQGRVMASVAASALTQAKNK